MSEFTCTKCSTAGNDSEISKHLSSTRHKTLKYNKIDEVVECEECEDSNIHQLLLLRYGLSDMGLLCQECLSKEEKPSTQYTLSNGSLLKKLHQYFKFRDIECLFCQNDKNLSVGNNKGKEQLENGQIIVCGSCLPKTEGDGYDFVSESSDKFLFALLGIKDHVASSSLKGGRKTRQRKTGRKGGKFGRKRASGGKDNPEAEERRRHYFETKAKNEALKSGKTIKAVGSEESKKQAKAQPMKSQGSRSVSPAVNHKTLGKTNKLTKSASSSQISNTNSKLASSGKQQEVPSSKKVNEKVENPKFTRKQSSISKSKPSNVGGPKVKSTASKKSGDKPNGKSSPLSTTTNKKKDTINQSLPQTPNKSTTESKSSSKPTTSGKVNGHKETKRTPGKDLSNASSKTALGPTLTKNGTKESKPIKPEQKNKASHTPNQSQTNESKPKDSVQVENITIPPGITKYEPSSEPLLSYSSMMTYFREMSYNLFLEEKLSSQAIEVPTLDSKEMSIEWFADQDKKHKQFKLIVPLTEDILNRFISKKMQALKKVPFSQGQTMFLMLGEDISWYGQIVALDTKSAVKGRKGGLKILEAIVELFKWNTQPLPISVNIKWLRILPSSIPVSRVFLAMSRIENPKFVSMLLGKEPIKQINFKNYLKFSNESLNDSQKVAIQSVMNNSITVLQGPPGSGKTSTIYEIILQLYENLHTFPILVVAASNIAIDNIAEKLISKHGTSILRIVANDKEKEYNREHPLSSICLHHKVYDSLPMSMKQTIDEMKKFGGSKVSQNQYKKLLSQQIEISDVLIAQAKVIFTTTVVAGGNQLKSVKKLPVVIMDEATQSSEPTTLIPLSMPGVDKFVFVGDQKQLSSFSQVPNLSLSLFERVLLNGTYLQPHMLDTQYRMHPQISEFPRKRFYGSLLKDGITASDRQLEGIPSNPVYFWDTKGDYPEGKTRIKVREDRGFTYTNIGEVELLTNVLIKLIYEKGIPRNEIGVITPYRGQRDLISSILVKNTLINPEKHEIQVEIDRDDIHNESKPITIHTVSNIMIASIDAFQGREKNFLVMSCVRSNSLNKIGFLGDERRLNVALTRAKYGLIIVGDAHCLLLGNDLWKEYLNYLENIGSLHASPEFTY